MTGGCCFAATTAPEVEGAGADAAVPAGRELSLQRRADGDRQKRMEWNRCSAEGIRIPSGSATRGWSSAASTRRDAGVPTPGCGLKAVKDRGVAWHWFFVTTRRVGVDLALVSDGGVPDAEQLREAVDGHGTVRPPPTTGGRGREAFFAGRAPLRRPGQPHPAQAAAAEEAGRAAAVAGADRGAAALSPALITTVAEAFRGLTRNAERCAPGGGAQGGDRLLGTTCGMRIAGSGSRRSASHAEQVLHRIDHAEAETRFAAHETELADVARVEELAAEKTG